jgi:hypothetical protein
VLQTIDFLRILPTYIKEMAGIVAASIAIERLPPDARLRSSSARKYL